MQILLKPKTHLWQRTRRVLVTLAILYLLFVLAVMLCQRRLLYFPTRLMSKVAEQMAVKEGLTAWRNKAGEIIGWKLSANAPATGVALIFHGNAGCALDRDYLAKPLHQAAPVDVFILEYPGYGARDGSPSQQSFLTAGEEAFDLLTNSGPIYLVGESLGTGVAAYLAKNHPAEIAGLMFFVPYNNLVSLAQQKMPFLPVKLIMWDRFNPAAWLKDYRGPVGFVLAEKDEVIPAQFGQMLYDGYLGPKMVQRISGAGHNEVSAQSPEWWRNIFSFWQEHSPQTK